MKLSDQLKNVRAELEDKRDERKALETACDEAKEKFSSSTTPVAEMTKSDDFKAAEQAVKALGEVDDDINDLTHAETTILGLMGEGTPASADPVRALKPGGWNASAITESEEYKALIEGGLLTSKSQLGTKQIGQLANREAAVAFIGGGSMNAADVGSDEKQGAIPADRRGIITPNLKRLSLLDLIPTGPTDSNIVEYTQVITVPTSAAEVEEGSLKPEQSFTTIDADAPVRTIAGWIKTRKQALADVAGLGTLLNTLLPHDVRRRIEAQIVSGDGTDQNLLGLLNTPGIGAPEAEAGDNVADTLLRAVTVVVLSDADPNFVALHPLTKQSLMLLREDEENRSGAYLYGTPSSPAAPTIWGLPMLDNRAVPEESPLVGDSFGATIAVREGVNVLFSDSDQDDFLRNRVTILAEARVAFPVWRPSSFAIAPAPGS